MWRWIVFCSFLVAAVVGLRDGNNQAENEGTQGEGSSAFTAMLKDYIRRAVRDEIPKSDAPKEEEDEVSGDTPLGRLNDKITASIFNNLRGEINEYVKNNGYIIRTARTKFRVYFEKNFGLMEQKLIGDFERYMYAGGIPLKKIREGIQSVLEAKNETLADINGYWEDQKDNIIEYLTGLFEKYLKDKNFLRLVIPKIIADFKRYAEEHEKERVYAGELIEDRKNGVITDKLMKEIMMTINAMLIENGNKETAVNEYLRDEIANVVTILIDEFGKDFLYQNSGLELKMIRDFKRYMKYQNFFEKVKEKIRKTLESRGQKLVDINEYLKNEMENVKEYMMEVFEKFLKSKNFLRLVKPKLIADFKHFVKEHGKEIVNVADSEEDRKNGGISDKIMSEIKNFIKETLIENGNSEAAVTEYLKSEMENIVEYLMGAFEKFLKSKNFLRLVKPKLIADFKHFVKEHGQERVNVADSEEDRKNGGISDKIMSEITNFIKETLIENGNNEAVVNEYLKSEMENVVEYLMVVFEKFLKNKNFLRLVRPKLIADFKHFVKEHGKERVNVADLEEDRKNGVISEKFMSEITNSIKETLIENGNNEAVVNEYLKSEMENVAEYLMGAFEKFPKNKNFLRLVKPKLIAGFKHFAKEHGKERVNVADLEEDRKNGAIFEKLNEAIRNTIMETLVKNGNKRTVVNEYLKNEMENVTVFLIDEFEKGLTRYSDGLELKIIGDYERYTNDLQHERDLTGNLVEEVKERIRKSLEAKGYKLVDINEYLEDEMKNIKGYLFNVLADYVDNNPEFMRTELISDFKRYMEKNVGGAQKKTGVPGSSKNK